MADEITNKCANLQITSDESSVISFEEAPDESDESGIALSLVGKVLTIRPYNFEAMKKTLNQIWSISKSALFRTIENGLFVVQFANPRDKTKVMAGRPWSFDQNLVLFNEIEGNAQPSNIALSHSPFWLRLYNLPMDSRTENRIRMIGSGVGTVLEVDFDGIVWDKSARVKVLVDVSKPLRRIQQIRSKGGDVAIVEVKYERLPNFCYVCGILGHIELDCLRVPEEDRTEERMWLRASPRRGRIKMMEEAKEFRSCACTLNFSPSPAAVEEVVAMSSPIVNYQATFTVDREKTLMHEPTTVHEGDNSQHEHASPCCESTPLNGSVSIPIPLLFDKGSVSPKKGRKPKVQPRKKNHVPKLPVLVKNCCLNVDINNNSGLKRKQSDDMILDDSVDMTLGQKKRKIDDGLINGSSLVTVEAEVGEVQPRPTL